MTNELKPFLEDMLSMSTGTDGRTLQIHFSRPVTMDDRLSMMNAHNAAVTRATPTADPLEGLRRLGWNSDDQIVDPMDDGKYVLYSEAAAVVAAKDARIVDGEEERQGMAKDWFNFCELVGADIDSHEAVASYVQAIKERAEAAEAKLAQYEAQEPVAYTLIFRKSHGINAETTFKKFEDAEKYAIRCELPLSSIIPLYASPAPAADLKEKCDRYERALRGIAELSATGMSFGDQVFAVTSSRAALKVEASNDKG